MILLSICSTSSEKLSSYCVMSDSVGCYRPHTSKHMHIAGWCHLVSLIALPITDHTSKHMHIAGWCHIIMSLIALHIYSESVMMIATSASSRCCNDNKQIKLKTAARRLLNPTQHSPSNHNDNDRLRLAKPRAAAVSCHVAPGIRGASREDDV